MILSHRTLSITILRIILARPIELLFCDVFIKLLSFLFHLFDNITIQCFVQLFYIFYKHLFQSKKVDSMEVQLGYGITINIHNNLIVNVLNYINSVVIFIKNFSSI